MPALYPDLVLQTIATDRANTPANESVPFTVGFQDMHTNYVSAFATRDARGNVRTTTTTNSFRLAYHTGGDSDRDGIPNEWESTHFDVFTGAVASANFDGDILNNLQEYIADTLPKNSNSCFTAIENIASLPGSTMQLQSPVPTSPQRRYDVWWTTSLVDNVTWHSVGLNIPGTGGSLTLHVTNNFPAATYRVGVKLP